MRVIKGQNISAQVSAGKVRFIYHSAENNFKMCLAGNSSVFQDLQCRPYGRRNVQSTSLGQLACCSKTSLLVFIVPILSQVIGQTFRRNFELMGLNSEYFVRLYSSYSLNLNCRQTIVISRSSRYLDIQQKPDSKGVHTLVLHETKNVIFCIIFGPF